MLKLLLTFLALILLAAASEAAPITLTCTASGDDSTSGTASQYDLRYKTTAPALGDTANWFATATQCAGEAVPLPAGTTQVIWTGDLAPAMYYFMVKVADEVPNWSGWSNVATKVVADVTPPFRIYDLR
jgi:hypothetical protein